MRGPPQLVGGQQAKGPRIWKADPKRQTKAARKIFPIQHDPRGIARGGHRREIGRRHEIEPMGDRVGLSVAQARAPHQTRKGDDATVAAQDDAGASPGRVLGPEQPARKKAALVWG